RKRLEVSTQRSISSAAPGRAWFSCTSTPSMSVSQHSMSAGVRPSSFMVILLVPRSVWVPCGPASTLSRPGPPCPGAGSQPFVVPEDHVQPDAEPEHEHQGRRVPPGERQFGHVVEVHAVDTADQSRGEQDCGPRGDLLHLLV